jgi:AraC-like DNA-binding protein
MAERPLPENIRGSWYFVSVKEAGRDSDSRSLQVFQFNLDGRFSIFAMRNGARFEKEKGEYTFDGNFLILRGRTTETYRVRTETYWRWVLEGKKEVYYLMRGLVSESDLIDLSENESKEVRILPIRVSVVPEASISDVIYELGFESTEHGRRLSVANFFTEVDEHRMWVGLTPYVRGIEPRTWERIIQDSFLDFFLNKPAGIRVVTVRFFGSDEVRVFNYSID